MYAEAKIDPGFQALFSRDTMLQMSLYIFNAYHILTELSIPLLEQNISSHCFTGGKYDHDQTSRNNNGQSGKDQRDLEP
jgi:hypothetical protein